MNNKHTLFKIFNKNDNHHGYKFVDGLNVDDKEFTNNKDCNGGGFYYANERSVLGFIWFGDYIRRIEIPQNATTLKVNSKKRKSSQLILHKRRGLNDINTWKWLVKHNINLGSNNFAAIQNIAINGYVDIMEYLMPRISADQNVKKFPKRYFTRFLELACFGGNVEMVKCILKLYRNVYVGALEPSVWCFAWAEFKKHTKLKKFLFGFNHDIYDLNAKECVDVVSFLNMCKNISETEVIDQALQKFNSYYFQIMIDLAISYAYRGINFPIVKYLEIKKLEYYETK